MVSLAETGCTMRLWAIMAGLHWLRDVKPATMLVVAGPIRKRC